MRKIFIVLMLLVFSIKSRAQTLVTNPEKYKIVASASYYSDKYPHYGIIQNIALTDLGSNIAGVLNSDFQTNYIKINQLGQITNLTTNTVHGFIGGHGLMISQNEQYYYYIYLDYITNTGGTQIARASINNGILSSSIVYTIDPNIKSWSQFAVNNNGDLAATFTYFDQNNQPTLYEVARINKLGQKTVLDTIPAPADLSYAQYNTAFFIFLRYKRKKN